MEALWSDSIDGWVEAAAGRASASLVAAPTEPAGARSAEPLVDGPPEAVAPPVPDRVTTMPVEVVRSAKRRKSVSARIVDGRIVVRMPTWMSKAQEAEYVTSLVAKLERQSSAKQVDLSRRAAELASRYDLPRPQSIRWVANQQHRWGSCTPAAGEIRITDRIAGFPGWVLDGVIVHELAHLVHLHHSAEFWELATRYPKTERAYGFLIAKQMTDDDDDLD